MPPTLDIPRLLMIRGGEFSGSPNCFSPEIPFSVVGLEQIDATLHQTPVKTKIHLFSYKL